MNPCFWQSLIPQHLLSRLSGKLAYCKWPWFKNWAIQRFLKQYPVKLEEAVISDPKGFEHFNDFFTRALKPDCRPLDKTAHAFVSPVDGTLSDFGRIDEGQLIQAKQHKYTLEALLGTTLRSTLDRYEQGLFATLYLAPHDYHRIHMPVSGELVAMRYVPGRLFSVNQKTAQHIPGLFAKNERVILFFETDFGPLSLVLVGAMIVASISTVFAGLIAPEGRQIKDWVYTNTPDHRLQFKKGDEIGRFHLGSTVITLLGTPHAAWPTDLKTGNTVYYGRNLMSLPEVSTQDLPKSRVNPL